MSNDTLTPNDRLTSVPALDDSAASETIALMQERLAALIDLQLTLKHVHWNVVGMNFIAVHEMLDPQVDAVRDMTDAIAERIATMGGEPKGTPGAVTQIRTWDDYPLDRAPTVQHLVELDKVYDGVAGDHRRAIARLGDLDPVSEDLFIGQLAQLELFQWFIRSHLKDSDGDIMHRRTS
jgi:starvation-inducible DNA-binding protein